MPPHIRTLIVEGEGPVESPTPDGLRAAVERMGRGGPGCVILEGCGGYASAVGGNGRYTAEWREPAGDGFRHWVAGRREDCPGDATIPAGSFEVTVRTPECLSASEVVTILEAFLEGRERPALFAWRDITDGFA
jgi:hypothetical protein